MAFFYVSYILCTHSLKVILYVLNNFMYETQNYFILGWWWKLHLYSCDLLCHISALKVSDFGVFWIRDVQPVLLLFLNNTKITISGVLFCALDAKRDKKRITGSYALYLIYPKTSVSE